MSSNRLLADCAYIPGRAHLERGQPCQDFALAGLEKDRGHAWAVVSDGCSTGGRTDIGARLLALAASSIVGPGGLASLEDPARLGLAVLESAEPQLAKLATNDAYATLGLLVSDGQRAQAVLYGDGLVVELKRDGRINFWNVTNSANAPRYLAYSRSGQDEQLWLATWGNSKHRVFNNSYRYEPDMGAELLNTGVAELPGRDALFQTINFPSVKDTLGLFLCTDGAVSFPDKTPIQALVPLTDVESPTAAFMQRRLGTLDQQWTKRGTGPRDDLAVAAIWHF